MKIRVVAIVELSSKRKVFFLNETEPKPLQLYMAIVDQLSLEMLTVYNLDTDQYEDVTSLFTKTYLQTLTLSLLSASNTHKQSEAL